EALAAAEIARELRLATVWSWGWGTFAPADRDADKPAAACVYLWARDASLCDGPAAAGADFDSSRAEGQIVLRPGVECSLGPAEIRRRDVERLSALTGDRDAAASALLQRAVTAAAA